MSDKLTYEIVFMTGLENYYGEVYGVKLSDGRYGLQVDSHSSTQIKTIPEDAFKALHDFFGDTESEYWKGRAIAVGNATEID